MVLHGPELIKNCRHLEGHDDDDDDDDDAAKAQRLGCAARYGRAKADVWRPEMAGFHVWGMSFTKLNAICPLALPALVSTPKSV